MKLYKGTSKGETNEETKINEKRDGEDTERIQKKIK